MIYNRANQVNHEDIEDMTKKVGEVGKVFQDMDVGEIQELINTTTKELTEDLMEMSGSQSVPDDQEEDTEEAVPEKVTLGNLAEGLQLLKTAFDFFYDMNRSTSGLTKKFIWVFLYSVMKT